MKCTKCGGLFDAVLHTNEGDMCIGCAPEETRRAAEAQYYRDNPKTEVAA